VLHVALLRGVNLGPNRRVAMGDLKALFETLGFGGVRTLIQSGNVVFSSTGSVTEDAIEAAVSDRFGMPIEVMLRTQRQMKAIVANNPFADAEVRAIHVGYMRAAPPAADVRRLDVDDLAPEQAVVMGKEVYFHLPNGMGRTRLPDHVGRHLSIPTTVRNWNTTLRLLEMMTT